jgi:phosphate transport system permease protein
VTSTQAPAPAPPIRRPGDRVFAGLSLGAGLLILAILAGVAVFLTVQGIPGITASPDEVKSGKSFLPYVWPLVYGTLIAATVAMLIAVPVAIGVALFISHYAPRKLGQGLGYLIDLLAAVPSVVYGLWGVYFLVPRLIPMQRWLDHHAGFIPLFQSRDDTFGRSIFAASAVLAIMILPIIAAIAREVFRQVPQANREAALALGATRWETIRGAVLPPSRSGVIGAVMLGLGRALGETIAVALVLAASFNVNLHIFEPGGNTIAANIATKFGESGILGREALIASGLVLFVITLAVNMGARAVVYRSTRIAAGKP